MTLRFGANSFFSSSFKAAKGGELNEGEKLLAAVLAGAASALVQCPCQLVEVNQSNHGSSMLKTARRGVILTRAAGDGLKPLADLHAGPWCRCTAHWASTVAIQWVQPGKALKRRSLSREAR